MCIRDRLSSPWLLAGQVETPNGLELATSVRLFCDYGMSNSTTSEVVLPRNYSKLSDSLCGETRTGVGCGKCRTNHTVHYHSPGFLCKPAKPSGCKFGWIFYILSELLPVTVVFITVLVLNISFTSGALNGFILFCQLLDSLDIYAGRIVAFSDSGIKVWTQGCRTLYGFFNLEFFNSESLSFCIWKGASALDMLAFKYFTILFLSLIHI